jgi:DNA-binding response OmpR family regulator
MVAIAELALRNISDEQLTTLLHGRFNVKAMIEKKSFEEGTFESGVFPDLFFYRYRHDVHYHNTSLGLTPQEYDIVLLLADIGEVNDTYVMYQCWGTNIEAGVLRTSLSKINKKLRDSNYPKNISCEDGLVFVI